MKKNHFSKWPKNNNGSGRERTDTAASQATQISPLHIFLGLVLEGHGVAALVLKSLGVDAEKTRVEIRKQLATR